MKRLYRSSRDRRFLGVCGGLAEYFEVDSTLVRLAFAVATVLSGVVPAMILYILAAIIMPEESQTH